MDTFTKAAKKREDEINVLEQTNPTGKLYSASQGREVDFSTKDPLSALPEVPGAQAAIDTARAGREASRSRAQAASDTRETFTYGKDGSSGYNTQKGSFYDTYGTFGRDRGADLLDAEAKGLITLSPQFKADLQKYRSLEAAEQSAWDADWSKRWSEGARVVNAGEEQPYRIVDGEHTYPPRNK